MNYTVDRYLGNYMTITTNEGKKIVTIDNFIGKKKDTTALREAVRKDGKELEKFIKEAIEAFSTAQHNMLDCDVEINEIEKKILKVR